MNVLRGILLVLVALVWAERAAGQVPFTARAGLEAARQAAGVNVPPSALGNAGELRGGGNAVSWAYAFRTGGGEVVGVVVNQETPGQFTARLIPVADTNDLPIYVNADPLPAGFIDSDSAMAIFRENSVYQEWMSSESTGEERLFAGRLREDLGEPAYTPVWLYSAINEERTQQLVCWCTVDGRNSGCWKVPLVEENLRPFSAHEGLEFAQQFIRTTSQPCFVAAQADTNGLGVAWGYVFPSGDTVRAVVVTSSAPGAFQGEEFAVEDTTDVPVYVRAAPFAAGWINSTAALERMRQTAEYRQWRASLASDSIFAFMYGGRSRPAPGSPIPPGTAVWIWVGTGQGPNPMIACVCNLENTAPFVQCSYVMSVSSPAQPGVMLAPNPASDVVVVRLSQERPIEGIVVHDLRGCAQGVPYISAGATAWLDVQGLAVGTYVVTVRSGSSYYRHLLQVVR
ncbi:MAG: T9SS type A sorting domain-containing protein [Chlorobiota bacterium]